MSRPRIRTIKPEFYGDEKVNALPIAARYLTVGLITMADDRGRSHLSVPAIRGFVFPRSCDSTERAVTGWLDQIVLSGIARAYEVAGSEYLWLPHFWDHQRINRPTESVLPSHPEDPYGDLAIVPALVQFRADKEGSNSLSPHGVLTESSLLNHGGLTPSRAGARSLPFPVVKNVQVGEDVKVDAREPRAVDQDALPEGLPDELADRVKEALAVLAAVQDERGGNVPTLRGVGLAVRRFPGRDHLRVARELEHWALAGTGQRKRTVDWARTFATFLEGSADAAPLRDPSGRTPPGPTSERDARRARRAKALDELMSQRGGAT